jgi:cell division initiation protein
VPYTPVELRHVRLGKTLFRRGYKRGEVDALLEDVADSFEDVWRERAELADRIEELEKDLADLKGREQLLAATLVAAEKAAVDAKENAHKEAELILSEAHTEARSIMRAAQGERERLFAEVRRIEALLRAALGMVQEADRESAEQPPEGERENWPRREDTREFGRASLFVPPDQGAQAG